jgi:hypothetical protein
MLSHMLRTATPKGSPKSLTYLSTRRNNANQSSYTETSVGLGTEISDRTIICVVVAQGGSSPAIVNSITIGGTAMTLYQANSTGQAGWYGVLSVPTGTSATVVTTFNQTMQLYSISFYRATGLSSLVPTNVNGTAGSFATAATRSNTTAADGFSLLAERHSSTNATTWTNAAFDNRGTNGTAYDSYATVNRIGTTALSNTVTATWGGSPVAAMMIQASFS